MRLDLIKIIVLISVFLTGLQEQLKAQSPSKRQIVEAAEREFADKNYYGALVYYNEALEYDPMDKNILFKSAEAARLFNSYNRAAEKYQYLVDSLNDDSTPLAIFWLGSMKQNMGKYDEARKYFDMYLSEFGGLDTFYTAKAKKELASIEYAAGQTSNYKRNIKFEKLGDDINTTASEVGGHQFNDEFYFSSMRYKEENPISLPARDISKILKRTRDSLIIPLDGYINNRDFLVANSSLSSSGTHIYYTVCEYINGSEIRCDIYRSNIDAFRNIE
jgi:tetratricopeptide (TPR) repeat protein